LRPAAAAALLALAACADEGVTGYAHPGPWHLVEIDGAPAGRAAALILPAPGRVRGAMACRAFEAQQTAPYPWFLLSHMEIEERPCSGGAAADEAILHAFASVTMAEAQGRVLILSDESGRMMVFRRR
jgi:heat shock protein HslJ